VSHAELALLRHLPDKTGLAGGLSRALATPRFLVRDRGRVMSDQRELFKDKELAEAT
jgi:hypothetical protein